MDRTMSREKRVFINGLGLVMGKMDGFKDLIQAVSNNSYVLPERIETINNAVSRQQLRRMDKISRMSLSAATKAKDDAGLTDMEHTGTVFNSVFGPMQTNITFAECVVYNDPDSASPSVFANTVNNACAGYVCMHLKCRGVSTMLLESNYVSYSQSLIKSGKAEAILAGGVDEYTESIFKSLEKRGVKAVESSVVLTLENRISEHTYCELLGGWEAMAGRHPYYGMDKDYNERIKFVLSEALLKYDIKPDNVSGIISTAPVIKENERSVIEKLFDMSTIFYHTIDSDALGAGIGIGLGIASQLIRQSRIPVLLVTHLEISGVYRVFVVKNVTEES